MENWNLLKNGEYEFQFSRGDIGVNLKFKIGESGEITYNQMDISY